MDEHIEALTLSDFYFGAVRGILRETIEAHVIGCELCRRNFFDLKRDIEMARVESEVPGYQIRKQIFSEAAKRMRQPSPPLLNWRWALFGGATLGAALVAVFMISRTSEQVTRQQVAVSAVTAGDETAFEESIDLGSSVPGHLNTL